MYRCPTCGTHDDCAYVQCDHPLCPDGHDHPVPSFAPGSPIFAPLDGGHKFTGHNVVTLLLVALILILAGAIGKARGAEYGEPDMAAYYRSLFQPDNGTSCCGDGDAYYADKTDACGPHDEVLDDKNPCAFVAIITDTRPDRIVRADGSVMSRIHIEPGTRVAVPVSKLRKKPIANPTDHNVIFVYTYGQKHSAICWEPVAGN